MQWEHNQQPAVLCMCYAARVGSIPMMDTLIQKGAGKALLHVSMYLKLKGMF